MPGCISQFLWTRNCNVPSISNLFKWEFVLQFSCSCLFIVCGCVRARKQNLSVLFALQIESSLTPETLIAAGPDLDNEILHVMPSWDKSLGASEGVSIFYVWERHGLVEARGCSAVDCTLVTFGNLVKGLVFRPLCASCPHWLWTWPCAGFKQWEFRKCGT